MLGQLVRFAVVGVLGAAVDYGTYQLGLHLGVAVTAARTVSFVSGTATVYVLNRRWTFGVAGGTRRAAGFALLYGTTFLVIIGINAAALAVLPAGPGRITFAWVLSQGFGTAVNFVMLRLVVFRR
jgi:putative flippase GtrA